MLVNKMRKKSCSYSIWTSNEKQKKKPTNVVEMSLGGVMNFVVEIKRKGIFIY
jgi:hypothetical protein